MRAMAIDEFGGADKLRMTDLPRPRPSRGELLIRVVAAGVSPLDVAVREGRLAATAPHGFPLVPGFDLAGVVEELGDGGSRLRVGDRVWAYVRKPRIQWGCYAEYVSVAEAAVGRMPSGTVFELAAGVPLGALAAEGALRARSGIEGGQNLLVQGAAGGVGHVAVQLARAAGARVFGTCGPDNVEFLLDLGAMAIDYTKEPFEETSRRHCPEGFDVVLDLVGGEVLARSAAVVRAGGRLVSLVETPDPRLADERRIVAHRHDAVPDGQRLTTLARLVERERLRPHLNRVFPLAEAAEAHGVVAGGHVRGKLVLGV
jgi:NADPH2:quinone reductase